MGLKTNSLHLQPTIGNGRAVITKHMSDNPPMIPSCCSRCHGKPSPFQTLSHLQTPPVLPGYSLEGMDVFSYHLQVVPIVEVDYKGSLDNEKSSCHAHLEGG